ncbi:Gmad2 immunoglobulin-like domain-containing protein [Flavobacterium sp.]|uniref:Gmad2 immunoglobulin-like domain-containing protein n=1 Tax=Flavobacterium sp. TaxID=239 RepID=UPI003263D950
MKLIIMFSILLCISCNKESKTVKKSEDKFTSKDTVTTSSSNTIPKKIFFNELFREVTVEKITANKFRVKGEGQIFEANFGWVVEDGHNELKSGFEQTDAGAPKWGKFDFSFEVSKSNENSTLTLILFETSAEDGSRKHELPISLL